MALHSWRENDVEACAALSGGTSLPFPQFGENDLGTGFKLSAGSTILPE
jgi:hypothetical protein